MRSEMNPRGFGECVDWLLDEVTCWASRVTLQSFHAFRLIIQLFQKINEMNWLGHPSGRQLCSEREKS
jgi:hypothetical protein